MRPSVFATLGLLLAVLAVIGSAGAATKGDLGQVTDRKVNLVWVADAGHVVSSGFSQRLLLSRRQAREFIQSMNQGLVENFGHSDWRLATEAELEYLYRTHDGSVFPSGFYNFRVFRAWFEKKASAPSLWKLPGSRSRDHVFPWPVRQAIAAPPGFSQVVIFADNSIELKKGNVGPGNLVANSPGASSTLVPGFEISIDKDASVAGDVTGASVQIKKNVTIGGTVFCNDLDDQRGGGATTCVPVSLPAFPVLPPFQQAAVRAGAPDVAVGPSQTVTLDEGDYSDITVDVDGTLVFSGGVYNIGSLLTVETVTCLAAPCRLIEFLAPTELRIAGRFDSGSDAFVGPAGAGTATPSTVILYVGGTNLIPADPTSQPAAAKVGERSTFQANLWAGNGTTWIKKETSIVGALLGRDVRVDKDSDLQLASFFNPPPVADPQDVFTTGTNPLAITLTGTDPDGETLTFSIVSGPSAGMLSGLTQAAPSSATVTYTANQPGDLFDSFVFRVTDPNGSFDEAVVAINPMDDPTPPPAPTDMVFGKDDAVETTFETPIEITLVGFADADDPSAAGPFSFSIVSPPSNGTVTVPVAATNRSATTTYTPSAGFSSPPDDSFTFQVCGDLSMPPDGDTGDPGECDDATVTVSVGLPPAPPVPPVAFNFTMQTPPDTMMTIDLTDGSSATPPQPGDRSLDAGSKAVVAVDGPNNPRPSAKWPLATAITVDSGWLFHNDCDLGSPCPDGPFTFTATGSGACVSVTDAFVSGDQYIVRDGLTHLGTTPPPVGTSPNESDPDLAFANAAFSSGTYYVGPGSHSIDVELTGVNAMPLAASFIRVDSVGSASGYCDGLPNLEVTAFSAPSNAELGEAIGGQIMVTLSNTGSVDIFPGTLASIGFYTSTDATIDTGDCLLAGGRENLFTSAPDGIPAGGSISDFLFAGANIDSPCPNGGNPPAGAAFIGVLADEFNILAESNEADNTASQAITIGPPKPDLIVSSFTHTPASPDSETQIEFTAVVENAGIASAGPSKLCIDIGGELCGGNAPTFDVPALDVEEAFTVRRFQALPEGTFLNNAVADVNNEVDESDENNNTAMDTVVVSLAREGSVGNLVATILSLPSVGSLFDSSGNQIMAVPAMLANTQVTYVPPAGQTSGTTSFGYQLLNSMTGLLSSAATVDIVITPGSCQDNEAFCDDGRTP